MDYPLSLLFKEVDVKVGIVWAESQYLDIVNLNNLTRLLVNVFDITLFESGGHFVAMDLNV